MNTRILAFILSVGCLSLLGAADGNFVNLNVSGRAGVGANKWDKHRLYVRGAYGDVGSGKTAILGYRSGAYGQTNGGTGFSYYGIDAAIVGFNYWGNPYSCGVAAYSYLDYNGSAGLTAGDVNGYYGARLAYRDLTGKKWSGYFTDEVYVGKDMEVNGTMKAKEIRVTMLGWPDFVFDEAYELPALSDVQDYIQANRHLPGIPSKLDVEQEGVDIGQVQKEMLVKIEELTLYLIQVKEENASLAHRLAELETSTGNE